MQQRGGTDTIFVLATRDATPPQVAVPTIKKMNYKRIISAILFVALSTGCEKSAVSDEQAVVTFKDCYQSKNGGDDYTLCLQSIVSDSRCPRTLECVWQGFAEAKFIFSTKNHSDTITLITAGFPPYLTDTVEGYKITFLNLSPYPGDPITETKAEVSVTR